MQEAWKILWWMRSSGFEPSITIIYAKGWFWFPVIQMRRCAGAGIIAHPFVVIDASNIWNEGYRIKPI